MILLLAISDVVVGIYIHRLNRPNDSSEILFFMAAALNIYYIALTINIQHYKEDIIYFKYFVEVHNKLVKNIDKNVFWDSFSTLLESLNKKEIDYNRALCKTPC